MYFLKSLGTAVLMGALSLLISLLFFTFGKFGNTPDGPSGNILFLGLMTGVAVLLLLGSLITLLFIGPSSKHLLYNALIVVIISTLTGFFLVGKF